MKTRSQSAFDLFRLQIERQGRINVDESTRELASHILMIAGSTFRDGEESIYRLNQAGFDRKGELMAYSRESA